MYTRFAGSASLQHEDDERSGLKSILTQWEYWPTWVFNIPVVGMWIWQGLRIGDLKFFTRANPSITAGGLFGDEKHRIYDLIPERYLPTTRLVKHDTGIEAVQRLMLDAQLDYPVVVKPDIGERGNGVQWIECPEELFSYHASASYNYIIQEAMTYPMEVSVLVYRLPDDDEVHITSVCVKEKLILIGDGKRDLHTLAQMKRRARKQWSRLAMHLDGSQVPTDGEVIMIEPIGNHSRGTRFIDGRHLIDEELRIAMRHLLLSMHGEVYYGRFDMLCQSLEDLKQLRHFGIIEFNGAKSEPSHIYDPEYRLTQAYRDILNHIRIIRRVARRSQLGRTSWPALWRTWRTYLKSQAALKQ